MRKHWQRRWFVYDKASSRQQCDQVLTYFGSEDGGVGTSRKGQIELFYTDIGQTSARISTAPNCEPFDSLGPRYCHSANNFPPASRS